MMPNEYSTELWLVSSTGYMKKPGSGKDAHTPQFDEYFADHTRARVVSFVSRGETNDGFGFIAVIEEPL